MTSWGWLAIILQATSLLGYLSACQRNLDIICDISIKMIICGDYQALVITSLCDILWLTLNIRHDLSNINKFHLIIGCYLVVTFWGWPTRFIIGRVSLIMLRQFSRNSIMGLYFYVVSPMLSSDSYAGILLGHFTPCDILRLTQGTPR